jgi:hypothetical protein
LGERLTTLYRKKRTACYEFEKNPEGKRGSLEDLGVDGEIMLELMLGK